MRVPAGSPALRIAYDAIAWKALGRISISLFNELRSALVLEVESSLSETIPRAAAVGLVSLNSIRATYEYDPSDHLLTVRGVEFDATSR